MGIVNWNGYKTLPPFCLFPDEQRRRSLPCKQSHLCGDGDGRRPGVHTQFIINTGEMGLDRALRDPQLDGNLLAALPVGHGLKDFKLAVGQADAFL